MTDSDVLERLAVLAGRSWSFEALAGGLNNSAFRVRTTDGRRPELDLVVRHWPEDDGLDHDVELVASVAAAGAGVGPAVVAHQPADRLIAFEHVPGRSLTAADLHDDATLARVAATLRRLHEVAADVPELGLLARTTVPEDVAAALAEDPEPLVLCHNDLVPDNLVDDGTTVTLIDFEYAGRAEPSAELAGLAVGAGFDDERVALLVRLYDGVPAPDRLGRVRLWQVVVRRLWSDWARANGHPQWVLDDLGLL
ncbi:MAG TPA: phosphotransferase [Nocardioides sp.]|nr:phosphotransferase [Nocardioides sp.]